MKVLYCGMTVLSAWPVGWLLAINFFRKPELSGLITLGLVCGALLSLLNSVASSLQVQEKFGRFAALQGVYAVVVCLGLLLLFLTTSIREVGAVIWLYLTVSTVTAGISVAILLRATPNWLRFESSIVREMVRFGKWIFLTALSLYTFPRIDGMVLASYLDLQVLGLYSVATQITMVIAVVTGSMSAVILPRAMRALNSAESLKQYFRDAARPVTIVLVVILLLEVTAPLLVEVVYGSEYAAAVWPLRILLVGYLFSSLYLPPSFLYYSLDLPHLRFFLETAKMLLVLVLFSQFIPAWGMPGAAAAMSLALAVNSLVAGGLLFFLLFKRGFNP